MKAGAGCWTDVATIVVVGPDQLRRRLVRARPVDTSVGRLLFVMAQFIAAVATDASRDLRAEVPKATIVGLGATTCQRFSDDVRSNPLLWRDYLAWAQGFMSRILSSRPPLGVDERFDLAPVTFPIMRQLDFLEAYYARNVSLDFSDAVAALYRWLRQEGKT